MDDKNIPKTEEAVTEIRKDILFREWSFLKEEIMKHDAQTNLTRNFSIATLTGLIGFILSKVDASPECGNLNFELGDEFLILPILVILFFALNEFFRQYWKWSAIERVYIIDVFLNH